MQKLQMGCVIEDDKVLTDDIFEPIQEWPEVQSVDMTNMQKLWCVLTRIITISSSYYKMNSFIHVELSIQGLLYLHDFLVNLEYLVFQSILRHRHRAAFLPLCIALGFFFLILLLPFLVFLVLPLVRYLRFVFTLIVAPSLLSVT